MRTLIAVGTFCAALTAGAANAHDFNATFETQAQCQRAWVEVNKFDRDFLREVAPGRFQTKGDVMAYLTKYIRCEYDPEEDVWYFEDNRPSM
jgi:hypothetical protein